MFGTLWTRSRMFSASSFSLIQTARRERPRLRRAASFAPAMGGLASCPSDPAPAGAEHGVLRMRDGVQVRFASWRPAGRARGTFWILQGRADFIEKYYETVRDLLARGFAVATFDWRGQGGSQRLVPDPRMNHAESFEPFVLDLEEMATRRWFAGLPRPFHALAHSMGANVLLQALARNPALFDSAALTAPMIALAPSLRPDAARLVASALCATGFGRSAVPGGRRDGEVSAPFRPDNLLTSCPVRYGRAVEMAAVAPHLTVGRPTLGWVRAALQAMRAVRDCAARKTIRWCAARAATPTISTCPARPMPWSSAPPMPMGSFAGASAPTRPPGRCPACWGCGPARTSMPPDTAPSPAACR